jgi:HIV Tat-specific factor 1
VAGVDENAPIERPKKRKKRQTDNGQGNAEKRGKQDNEDTEKPRRERQITSVYVSNLPSDVTVPEVQEYFGKCGVIAEDASGQKRVKLYHDENGVFKGDALITYFKPESVPLALQLLDETPLTRADGRPSPLIRVQVVCHRSLQYDAYGRPNSKARRLPRIRRIKRKDLLEKFADFNGDDKN